jgi:hypothetical protein
MEGNMGERLIRISELARQVSRTTQTLRRLERQGRIWPAPENEPTLYVARTGGIWRDRSRARSHGTPPPALAAGTPATMDD